MDGQVLELGSKNIVSYGEGIDPSSLSGVVIDDEKIKFSGEWIRSSSRPFIGSSYHHDGNTGKGMRSAEFPFQVERNGLHEVRVSFLPHGNRAGEVRYVIDTAKGKQIVRNWIKEGRVTVIIFGIHWDLFNFLLSRNIQ